MNTFLTMGTLSPCLTGPKNLCTNVIQPLSGADARWKQIPDFSFMLQRAMDALTSQLSSYRNAADPARQICGYPYPVFLSIRIAFPDCTSCWLENQFRQVTLFNSPGVAVSRARQPSPILGLCNHDTTRPGPSAPNNLGLYHGV
jgi:hypothetical protein